MKKAIKYLVISLGILLLVGVGAATFYLSGSHHTAVTTNFETPVTQTLLRVGPADFKQRYDSGEYKVIDVRASSELTPENGGTIFSDIIHFDFYKKDFQTNLDTLDRSQPYLIYCRGGVRSNKALEIMKDLGFLHVVDLIGGKDAWDKYYGQ